MTSKFWMYRMCDGLTQRNLAHDHAAQMAWAAFYLARTGADSVVAIVARYADEVIALRSAQAGAA